MITNKKFKISDRYLNGLVNNLYSKTLLQVMKDDQKDIKEIESNKIKINTYNNENEINESVDCENDDESEHN